MKRKEEMAYNFTKKLLASEISLKDLGDPRGVAERFYEKEEVVSQAFSKEEWFYFIEQLMEDLHQEYCN